MRWSSAGAFSVVLVSLINAGAGGYQNSETTRARRLPKRNANRLCGGRGRCESGGPSEGRLLEMKMILRTSNGLTRVHLWYVAARASARCEGGPEVA